MSVLHQQEDLFERCPACSRYAAIDTAALQWRCVCAACPEYGQHMRPLGTEELLVLHEDLAQRARRSFTAAIAARVYYPADAPENQPGYWENAREQIAAEQEAIRQRLSGSGYLTANRRGITPNGRSFYHHYRLIQASV